MSFTYLPTLSTDGGSAVPNALTRLLSLGRRTFATVAFGGSAELEAMARGFSLRSRVQSAHSGGGTRGGLTLERHGAGGGTLARRRTRTRRSTLRVVRGLCARHDVLRLHIGMFTAKLGQMADPGVGRGRHFRFWVIRTFGYRNFELFRTC